MGNKVMDSIPLTARRLREERGWTQQQLCLRGGLNQGYLSEVERNERNWSMSWLLSLAASLGVEWWTLFGYSHPPEATLSGETIAAIEILERMSPEARQRALRHIRVEEDGG